MTCGSVWVCTDYAHCISCFWQRWSAVCVQVTGEANENQVCEALRRYRARECFILEALVHLYNLITDTDKPRPDILKVSHPKHYSSPVFWHSDNISKLTKSSLFEGETEGFKPSWISHFLYKSYHIRRSQQLKFSEHYFLNGLIIHYM